jgi:hypothetical protein
MGRIQKSFSRKRAIIAPSGEFVGFQFATLAPPNHGAQTTATMTGNFAGHQRVDHTLGNGYPVRG